MDANFIARFKRRLLAAVSILLIAVVVALALRGRGQLQVASDSVPQTSADKSQASVLPHSRVYWLIPQGLRADTQTFKIYEWAREGKLPNIKRLMDKGSYGYSRPVFPTESASNLATLLTGVTPARHGITGGPIGQYKVQPLWKTMVESGWRVELIQFSSEEDGAHQLRVVEFQKPHDWHIELPTSYSPLQETSVRAEGVELFALLIDSRDDNREEYTEVLLSPDKGKVLFKLKNGQSSPWFDHPRENAVERVRLRAVRLGFTGQVQLRLMFEGRELPVARAYDFGFPNEAGPDPRPIRRDEWKLSWQWHFDKQTQLRDRPDWRAVVHIVPMPKEFLETGFESPDELLEMYQQVDRLVGGALEMADWVILSSDQGVLPVAVDVRINNFFASRGWLAMKSDRNSRGLQVDLDKTRVLFQPPNQIFIHSKKLSDSTAQRGREYEQLRQRVVAALKNLTVPQGQAAAVAIKTREEVAGWGLPQDRVGDLVVSVAPGFRWIEAVSQDLQVFGLPQQAGYSAGVMPANQPGLKTPFLIAGPGIRADYELRQEIQHVQQYPTIVRALEIAPAHKADGDALTEIVKKAGP